MVYYRDYFSLGGIPRETQLLCRSLAPLVGSLAVDGYVRGPDTIGLRDAPAGFCERTHERKRIGLLGAVRSVPKSLRTRIASAGRPDVVLVIGSFIPENAAVCRLARQLDIPYFVSIGAAFNPFLFARSGDWKKCAYELAVESRVMRNARGLRLYSSTQYEHLSSRGYEIGERGFVIREGIDREDIERVAPHLAVARPPIESARKSDLVFGFLGRPASYTKGLDVLAKAWTDFAASSPNGRLMIAGARSKHEQATVQRLFDGIPRVRILGEVRGAEKYEYLAQLSILVAPSRHEGIPRVVREALAVGCPVIASDGTNLHDLISTWEAGFECKPDSTSLLHALRRAQAHWASGQMTALSTNARRLAGEELDWDIIARRFLDEICLRI